MFKIFYKFTGDASVSSISVNSVPNVESAMPITLSSIGMCACCFLKFVIKISCFGFQLMIYQTFPPTH